MFKDRFILFSTTASIVALQVALWSLFLRIEELPKEVAFWYTLPPADRLAPAAYLWTIPVLATGFLVINTIIALLLFRKYPATSQMLVACSALACILAAIAIVKTILIYTSLL